MKLSLKQLILFLGGSGIAVTAKATDIVHAFSLFNMFFDSS